MSDYRSTAVAATDTDAGVTWHYGDPLREQRALATGAGVIDRSNRDVVIVTGEDRLPWLHSICSQHVTDLHDGDSTESLVLSPHGHVEQHWQVTELRETVWLDTEPGAAPAVLKYLQMMRFLKRVEPADVTEQWAVLSVVGPASAAVLALAGMPVPETSGRAEHLDGGGFVRRMPWPGADAVDLVVPRMAATEVFDRLVAADAVPAGVWAFEAARVEARRPRLGFETDHRTIPHEVGWIGPAVHLDKGCYRGQETVARVQNLGRPPRMLALAHLAGETDALPEPGTPIEVGGRTIGFLGTAVHHYELGPIALVVVKRNVPATATLQIGSHTAQLDLA